MYTELNIMHEIVFIISYSFLYHHPLLVGHVKFEGVSIIDIVVFSRDCAIVCTS